MSHNFYTQSGLGVVARAVSVRGYHGSYAEVLTTSFAKALGSRSVDYTRQANRAVFPADRDSFDQLALTYAVESDMYDQQSRNGNQTINVSFD